MAEKEILQAFRSALQPGEQVRHVADWKSGEYRGSSRHPMYDAQVHWFDGDDNPRPCYLRNLYPVWWPTPEWAKGTV